MNLLPEAKRLIHLYNVKPRKRLGQNFAVNDSLLERMIGYAELNRSDAVLDVGAGLGFLTEKLAEKAGRVVAIEMDALLVTILNARLSRFKNVKIIQEDVLKMELPPFTKVVSNPPYVISSPLMFKLLTKNFSCGVLTLQEEFARRLVAATGTSEYGRLTVMTYYYAEAELLEWVSRKSFLPQPDVDSAVVRLKPRKAPFNILNEDFFSDLVRKLFTQRNRRVHKALRVVLRKALPPNKKQEDISGLPFLEKRVDQLAPEDFGVLSNEVYRKLYM